jgi:hypothetical protein
MSTSLNTSLNTTLSRPVSTNLSLKAAFAKDDVLYKIIDGKICSYIVMQVLGSARFRLVACNENGDKTEHRFDIQDMELKFYGLDIAYTRLRRKLIDIIVGTSTVN